MNLIYRGLDDFYISEKCFRLSIHSEINFPFLSYIKIIEKNNNKNELNVCLR